MDGFLSEYTLAEKSSRGTGSSWKPLRSDICAVVLSGDASAKGFEHLQAILQHLFHDLPSGWLKKSIDPSAVAAVGAANFAYHLSLVSGNKQVPIEDLAGHHDEL